MYLSGLPSCLSYLEKAGFFLLLVSVGISGFADFFSSDSAIYEAKTPEKLTIVSFFGSQFSYSAYFCLVSAGLPVFLTQNNARVLAV